MATTVLKPKVGKQNIATGITAQGRSKISEQLVDILADTYTLLIKTFSHAVGTLRMGADPSLAPLDEIGRYRGLANLRVVDGSALPTAGAVNPSLTIAANALRVAAALVREG